MSRGRRQGPGLCIRLCLWLQSVPHLFGKLVVAWCLCWGTMFGLYALRIVSRTGNDPTGTLLAIYGFLGSELLMMCGRTILNEK